MSDKSKQYADPLVRQRVFPEAGQVFAFSPISLKDAIKDSVIVVDTNVLLVPYSTGQASLDQIQQTFERLTKEQRLRIPGQVAREFADNRAEKLKTLFQQLSRKRDVNLTRSEYPLLKSLPAYQDVAKREVEIVASLEEYRKAVAKLLDTVAEWGWDDPVSNIYRSLFESSVVIDPQLNRESVLEELRYRQEHKLPPGYKDANNEYSGVGDFLIWKTILKIGSDESRHLIFVSGDEKTDWRYQSENRALYPRFELVDEYRVASSGKSFLMISFAELLEQFGAPTTVIEEVRQEEVSAAAAGAKSSDSEGLASLNEGLLSIGELRDHLTHKYPLRKSSSVVDYGRLLAQLADAGIDDLGKVDLMLERVKPLYERKYGPVNSFV